MKKWSNLRAAFANHQSQNEDVESPALKQPRRASSPYITDNNNRLQPIDAPTNRASNRWTKLKVVVNDNSEDIAMPQGLPAIGDKPPIRREKTYHLGPTENNIEQPLQIRRFSSTAIASNTIVASQVASKFSNHLLVKSKMKLRLSGGHPLISATSGTSTYQTGTSTITVNASKRDPDRVPVGRLFRAICVGVHFFTALYNRSVKVTHSAYNLSDIMALATDGADGGGGSGTSSKDSKAKKSTTTAALDYSGNVVKFNMDDFKSNMNMKLTEKAKRILTRHPSKRTDDDIHYVMIALKSVPQISEYPLAILRLIVRFGFFESFEARRVLIRQGHMPMAYYFILYGEVAVAVNHSESKLEPAKLAVKLKRGESFGELAIITGLPRQSTCVTLGYCEFIKLWKEEYIQIFKVGGMANFNNTEVLNFLKSSELMAGWPLELLKTHPEVILFSYFKAGSVVVKDVRKSPWLVIVKSGRADAIAVIPKHKPTVSEKTGRLKHETERSARRALSILFHLSKHEFDRELESSRFHKLQLTWSSASLPLGMLPYRSTTTESFYVDEDEIEMRAASFPAAYLKRNRQNSAAAAVVAAAREGTSMSMPDPILRNRTNDSIQVNSSQRNMYSSKTTSDDESADDETNVSSSANIKGRKTMFNLVNEDEGYDYFPAPSANVHQEFGFIGLQQLGDGNVFGLESHLKLTDCRLMLQSQGCECILLNWQFFQQHCSNVKLAQLQTWAVSSNYPSAQLLEEMYQDEVNWNTYRKYLLRTSIAESIKNRNAP